MFTATKTQAGTKLAVGILLALGVTGAALAALPAFKAASYRASECVISGCNSEYCSEGPVRSLCVLKAEAICYQTARCEKQATGRCGWTPTQELTSCLARLAPQAYAPPQNPCVKTGCRGEICSDQEVRSACIMGETDICYQNAQCARQGNGQCGWTPTPEVTSCLARFQPQAYVPPPIAVPPLRGKIQDSYKCGGLDEIGCELNTPGTIYRCKAPFVIDRGVCRLCQGGKVFDGKGGCAVPEPKNRGRGGRPGSAIGG